MRTDLSENRVSLQKKKFDNLIGSLQPKKIISKNQSGSHNIMRELKLVGSQKNVRTAQHW
jgi:hypothetical protein